nr:hypothetical protein [Tanacetum cinerariifolium]
ERIGQLVPLGHLPLLLLKENQVLHKRLLSLDFVFLHDTRLTPPTPISTTDETDDLQDTLQVSLVKQKSRKELEATQNVEKVKEHLIAEEIENIRLEPKSDKESPEVEKIADISQPLNVIEEEEESTEVDYELRRQAKRKHFMPRRKFHELAKNIIDIMKEALPKLVDDHIKVLLKKQVQLYVAKELILEREKSQAYVAKMIVEALQQERENLCLEISSQVNDAIANHIPSQKKEHSDSKKEKRVMRHQEVHKFCDVTLKRVLEGLKSYNNDVKYGYVTYNLNKDEVEYLQLLIEEIEERLKFQDQMRRWEMYENGRPQGSRRERPE